MSSNAKKIGLIACTGVVAGNMMGSGIALLPSSLASVGSVSIFSWLICLVGALSLAFVYARLATKNPQEGGPIAYAGEVSPVFGSKRAFFITTRTGLVTWLLPLQVFLTFQYSSLCLITQSQQVLRRLHRYGSSLSSTYLVVAG